MAPHHDKSKTCQCVHCSCKKRINKILSSVAEIENALANAINAESNLLKQENLSSNQINMITEKLEELIKLAIKKEIVLELLIQDAIKACDQDQDHDHNHDKDKDHPHPPHKK